MRMEVSVTKVKEIFKIIKEEPEQIFEMMRFDIQETVGNYLTALMGMELTRFLGREFYEHGRDKVNHRNGSYDRRFTLKGIGDVQVAIPRDRLGEYKTRVIPRSRRYEQEISRDLSLLFLSGISTRSLSMISQRLIGRRISPSEVSLANVELVKAVEKWRTRDLSKEPIKYLFVDGVNFRMRVGKKIETTPVLVAIGVTENGQKLVLSLQAGDKESASNWREFFKDLKRRGLNGRKVRLGIMDGLSGLETVFKEEFRQAQIQRCQVHVSRNVLAKVPKKLKETVAADLKAIFYASSKKEAVKAFKSFTYSWGKQLPSAVSSLERSIDACLTFFDFPKDEWLSLRTSNIIERLNKEFKRRTKSMEIVPGEAACYRLLAFISLKMELHWRSTPIGKVRKNLPFFQELARQNLHN